MLDRLKRVRALLGDPRVAKLPRFAVLAAIAYLISPVDLVPDFLPVIGEMDDLVVAFGALKMFLNLCPPAAEAFHRAALDARRPFSRMEPADVVIEPEFHRQ